MDNMYSAMHIVQMIGTQNNKKKQTEKKMKTKLIPFAMTPKGLTTKGKAREIAKANYELDGIELKKALAMLDCESS